MQDPSKHVVDAEITWYMTAAVDKLAMSYPTPAILRHKANQLEAARPDEQARSYVGLMRAVADDMESGVFEDDGWPLNG